MITEFNENGHPMVFSDASVNTEQLKEKCIKAIESLSGVHGAAERKAQACFMIALSELENNWKQRAEAAEAKLAELAKQEPAAFTSEHYWSELNTFGAVKCVLLKNGNDPDFQVELFTHPAPAADLDELVPPKASMADYYENVENPNLVEPYEAGITMWNACRAEMLRKISEANK